MSIALITANFGGIDIIKTEPKQEGVEYKRFYFNETNTPFPLPNLPPRLQAKYFKTQSHKIPALKDYYIHCWVDAGFQIKSPHFLEHATSQLDQYYHIGIENHPLRNCIYDEVRYIHENINDPYLHSRYASQPLKEELEYYWSYGMPKNYGLYACGMFIRDITKTENFFNEWWDLCLRWSYFDQTAFAFLAWKEKPALVKLAMGNYFDNRFYEHTGHLR